MGQLLLFVVVALVVATIVFGVTVMVSGGDSGLTPVEPDSKAVALPGDRPLGEEDVFRTRFDTAVRGYRMSQVDQALQRAAYDIGYKGELIGVLEAEVVALREGRTADAEALRKAREAAMAPAAVTPVPAGNVDLLTRGENMAAGDLPPAPAATHHRPEPELTGPAREVADLAPKQPTPEPAGPTPAPAGSAAEPAGPAAEPAPTASEPAPAAAESALTAAEPAPAAEAEAQRGDEPINADKADQIPAEDEISSSGTAGPEAETETVGSGTETGGSGAAAGESGAKAEKSGAKAEKSGGKVEKSGGKVEKSGAKKPESAEPAPGKPEAERAVRDDDGGKGVDGESAEQR